MRIFWGIIFALTASCINPFSPKPLNNAATTSDQNALANVTKLQLADQNAANLAAAQSATDVQNAAQQYLDSQDPNDPNSGLLSGYASTLLQTHHDDLSAAIGGTNAAAQVVTNQSTVAANTPQGSSANASSIIGGVIGGVGLLVFVYFTVKSFQDKPPATTTPANATHIPPAPKSNAHSKVNALLPPLTPAVGASAIDEAVIGAEQAEAITPAPHPDVDTKVAFRNAAITLNDSINETIYELTVPTPNLAAKLANLYTASDGILQLDRTKLTPSQQELFDAVHTFKQTGGSTAFSKLVDNMHKVQTIDAQFLGDSTVSNETTQWYKDILPNIRAASTPNVKSFSQDITTTMTQIGDAPIVEVKPRTILGINPNFAQSKVKMLFEPTQVRQPEPKTKGPEIKLALQDDSTSSTTTTTPVTITNITDPDLVFLIKVNKAITDFACAQVACK